MFTRNTCALALTALALSPLAARAADQSSSNAFNPDISLILSGIYTNLSQDPADFRIANFISGGEIGPGQRGLSLAESELGISANIDPQFFGALNFAIHPDDTVSSEEAFVQTTALSQGVRVKFGRFFSGIGYVNEQHAHTWDFVDNPLAYQAFLGTQYGDDGVQLKWLLPTPMFAEVGAEIGRGRNFPGSDRDQNGSGASAVYAHIGADVGVSHSWRAGVSMLRASPRDRQYDDTDRAGAAVTNAFSGTSRLWIADLVWKWAPDGNGTRNNFKLQGEYLHRKESGDLAYDVNGANTSAVYASTQSGWYLQGVYQFMPAWRVGLRVDLLDRGTVDYGANAGSLGMSADNPSKLSAMVDWTPSEFSRVRLQLARDKSRPDGVVDDQVFVQYQMSLGAHGAHTF